MANHMLYVGTHGGEDPNRAGLLFSAALAARANQFEAQVALLGDAVFLLNDKIASETRPMNRPSLKELIDQATDPKQPYPKIVIHC